MNIPRHHFSQVALLTFSILFSCHPARENRKLTTIQLSDTLATVEAANLYCHLYELLDQYILVGHQDALAYGMGWKGDSFRTDIHDVCGKHPAIFGWDLGHIGDTHNIDSVPFDRMKQWAIAAYEQGGINTYSWHMRNIASRGSSWDTSPCVRDILPGGKFHKEYLAKLDEVSAFFESLKTTDGTYIPVIFRPFHEMNGDWFWWGLASCTPGEYKKLFRFTVDYLRKEKNLHQILYVYSTDVFESAGEYMLRYPGDDYVDILGFDDYKGLRDKANSHRTVTMLQTLDSIASSRSKLFALSETGLETIPDPEWFTQVVLATLEANSSTIRASWVLFWRNGRPDHFYAPYPGHPSAEDFIRFEQDSITLFLQDIPDLYH